MFCDSLENCYRADKFRKELLNIVGKSLEVESNREKPPVLRRWVRVFNELYVYAWTDELLNGN